MSLKRAGLKLWTRSPRVVGFTVGVFLAGTLGAIALVSDLRLVAELHEQATEEHVDQAELNEAGPEEAFEEAFEDGDELFETAFNAIDGGGANIGNGSRFTRVPRADLKGAGQWAAHTPARATGPNAQACNECHSLPFDDGAGTIDGNVHRDPLHSGSVGSFIQRNTPHVFAPGAVQRVAEEMTTALHATREQVRASACASGSGSASLVAKGVGFGVLSATRTAASPCAVTFNTSGVQGVDADLVVKPFQWKGSVVSLRDFNRGAAHNELGMQAVEVAGHGVDGDGDGVDNELTVGDMTALTVYLAAQPRPTTKLELASLGLIPALTAEETADINRGAQVFASIGCASCHTPSMTLDDPTFSEPSQHPSFRDAVFPAGQNPVAEGVTPADPIFFDLTRDQPDNQIKDEQGNVIFRLGSLAKNAQGKAVAELFGDLKRHDLGAEVAEAIDEVGTGRSTFLTENLWGVGSTAPYLHDGRATTLAEAILEHGGESAAVRGNFVRLPKKDAQAVIAFLNNLVLFKMEEEE